MTFKESISYIKTLDVYGSVLGLESMYSLAEELDNPQDGLKFIHITGTNGKGSVSAYISNILISAGYKVGTYNSPAVISCIDQFKINMKNINKTLYAEAIDLVKSACDRMTDSGKTHPTRFEVETMAAFVAFYLEKCDIVVLETGLGGRDDATNIVSTTLLHVFTSISMDHALVLGDTIEKIALNKSGIIKSSSPSVICKKQGLSKEQKAGLNAILNRCKEYGSQAYFVSEGSISNVSISKNKLIFDYNDCVIDDVETKCLDGKCDSIPGLQLKMKGAYQPLNAAVAIKAIRCLIDQGYNISEEDVKSGIRNTEIPFRFEKIKWDDEIDIVLDGAHNPDGAKQFVRSIDLNYPGREFIFITGIFKDKDYRKIVEIVANKARKIYAIQNTKSERSLDKELLAETFREYNKSVYSKETIETALSAAIRDAKEIKDENDMHPVVCCLGSLSWLNEAKEDIKLLREKQFI